MFIFMQKLSPVPANTDCLICLEKFEEDSKVLGHQITRNVDNKIYGHVHEHCLKEAIETSRSLKCPHCRGRIKASSIYSWKDLPKEDKKHCFRYVATRSALYGSTLAISALMTKKAMFPVKGSNDFDLVKVTGFGTYFFSSISLLRESKKDTKENIFYNILTGLFAGASGFIMGSENFSSKQIGIISLAYSIFNLSGGLLTAKWDIEKSIDNLDQQLNR